MTANEIRDKFLKFFQSKKHTIVASDSLVPKEDPTVLFTTAGMQQFKRQFLGHTGDYTRAASSQKCLRTDDLDVVGKTNFHHTFFEMLGNFSFGDYFKAEAIAWAWEFLTEELKIVPEKLWVSVYKDDTEAEHIWLDQIGIPKNKLVKLGDKSNFWPAEAKEKGPNGPCGPCSEIFYDYGVNPDCKLGDQCNPDCNCGRFSEIWNLVFTQFNRKEDGTLEPLPSKNIYTGMGLERLTAVMQGKKNNFETDLFAPIIAAVEKEIEKDNVTLSQRDKFVIADHIRGVALAIADGVMPSNEGRGYVIKRLIIDMTDILSRSGIKNPNISRLVPVVQKTLDIYTEIETKAQLIVSTINKIEEAYLRVRKEKIPALSEELKTCTNADELGNVIFTARDTHGLTLPTILSTATDQGISEELQKAGLVKFNKLMQQQQERSRASSKIADDVFANADLDLRNIRKTVFLGHQQTRAQSKILKIFIEKKEASEAQINQEVKIILNETPFYAESGGQVGDTGMLNSARGKVQVQDTVKNGDIFVHTGTVTEGTLRSGQTVDAVVDQERRMAIMRNHTATHLLQAALRHVLGDHVQQQGSVVDAERLRFDFTHPKALTDKEIVQIEEFVHRAVLANKPVTKQEMSLNEAREAGALAFFEEKYGDTVRMVTVEGTSKELCGGTHLDQTGNVGLLKIVNESAIAQGIRRIEAKTGWGAFDLVKQNEARLKKAAQTLKTSVAEIDQRASDQIQKIKRLEKELEKYRFDAIKSQLESIIQQAPAHEDIKCIHYVFDNIEIGLLRKICDHIRQKSPSAVIILGSRGDENSYILVAATDSAIAKGMQADQLVASIAPLINGSGGGRPNLAQAGTRDTKTDISRAIEEARKIVAEKLST